VVGRRSGTLGRVAPAAFIAASSASTAAGVHQSSLLAKCAWKGIRILGRVGEFLRRYAVEADRRREPRHMHGGGDGQRAAHAETHARHLAAHAMQMLNGAANVLVGGAGKIEAVHQVAGLVRILRDAALEQVRRQRVVAGGGEAVGDAADLRIEAPPFLDHHHTRAALAGTGEIAAYRRCRPAA
jgi:hypothetical protein